MGPKIYTKTGDKGETSLFSGGRVQKHHIRLEAYGTVDELNSHIGLCRALLTKLSRPAETHLMNQALEESQNRLFDLGSHLASADPQASTKLPPLEEPDIAKLEQEIDRLDQELPALRMFILPGGDASAAALHVARTVCRRAERRVLALHEQTPVDPYIIRYLNRLSDLLFIMARKANVIAECPDQTWHPKKS